MAQRVKKNDTVVVITGRDKGMSGSVLAIDYTRRRVLVKGVGIVTRHVKPRRQGEKGKIIKEEAYIALSNVMPVCPSTKKPTRVRVNIADGRRVRVSVRSGEAF